MEFVKNGDMYDITTDDVTQSFTLDQLKDLRGNTARHLLALQAEEKESDEGLIELAETSLAEYNAFFAEEGIKIED